MPEDVFGPLASPWSVETAVLQTLEDWADSYAAEVERKNGLSDKVIGRPLAPDSYRGGLDWQSVKQDWMPMLIAIANPVGEPERQANTYIQAFQVEVGAVVFSEETENPEAMARRNAGLWAAACMGILVQHGDLGNSEVEETVLVGAPKVEFIEAEDRRFAVGITTYHVYIQLIRSNSGPLLVQKEAEEPYPEWPAVKEHTVKVKAVEIDEEV